MVMEGNRGSGNSSLPTLMLFAILAIGAVVLAGNVLEVSIHHREHAVSKHGQEAIAVRQACDNGGRMHTYKSRSWRTPNKFYEICQLDDGRVGLRIREWSKKMCRWFERSSYIVKSGTYAQAMEYVTARAAESTWKTVKGYGC